MIREEKPKDYILVEKGEKRIPAIEAEIKRRKGFFITDFLRRERAKLGSKKFEQERDKLAKEGGELYDLMRAGWEKYRALEDQSHR